MHHKPNSNLLELIFANGATQIIEHSGEGGKRDCDEYDYVWTFLNIPKNAAVKYLFLKCKNECETVGF